jgi:hypothetical protein
MAIIVISSCSKESDNPALQCGTPTTENYMVGQVDTACVFAEMGENWINFPETVSRFECGRILKSDFINYDENLVITLLLTIPHEEGQNCQPLSPDAIQVGKYSFISGNSSSQPGEAGFSVKVGRKLYASWDTELAQTQESFIEVTSVEDIDPKPQWVHATYHKRVRGRINCQLKELDNEENDAFEVKNMEFSVYMVY